MWTNRPVPGRLAMAALVVAAACGTGAPPPPPDTGPEAPAPPVHVPGAPRAFPMVDDNVRHDTLLAQVFFDLGDGAHLMVASHVEETFEGVRLYHYRARPDSSAEVISVSAPGYDSWTMLPTIFGEGTGLGGKWVLANFGERESWGQKVMWYDGGFHDRGFMHLALVEWTAPPDSVRRKRTNVAPHMRMHARGDTTEFTFACDSLYMYDDARGGYDLVVPAGDVRYTLHPDQGLVLWLRGEPRPVLDPA